VDAARGDYTVRLSAPILGLPVSLRGRPEQGVTQALVLGMFAFDLSAL